MANHDDKPNHKPLSYVPPYPLFLSSFDMQILTEISMQGVQALYDNPVAQDTVQQLALALVASMRVKELNPELIPPPLCLTVTTMFQVTCQED